MKMILFASGKSLVDSGNYLLFCFVTGNTFMLISSLTIKKDRAILNGY